MNRLALITLMILALLVGCTQQAAPGPTATPTPAPGAPTATPTPEPSIIGGETDEHGCYIAAGYSWCKTKQKCLRTFEEDCPAAPTATPVPDVMYTYLSLVSKYCYPTNIGIELWNTGGYATGTPLVRLQQVENGAVTKTCLEFTLKDIARQNKMELSLFNKDYGVEPCDYTTGAYRLVAVEPGPTKVMFNSVDIVCG